MLDEAMSMGGRRYNAPRAGTRRSVLMQGACSQPRRVRVDRGVYRSKAGRYEIAYTDSSGRQRWETVRGGIRGGPGGTRCDRHQAPWRPTCGPFYCDLSGICRYMA
jgi:hypothetical protein